MKKLFQPSLNINVILLIMALLVTSAGRSATITSIGNGNWSASAWPNTTRTGTISTSASSTAVSGAAGSLFLTEISIGNIIKTTGNVVIGTVLSITSNTSLTLAANAASSNVGIAYNVQGIGSADIAQINGGNTITVDLGTAFCAGYQSGPSAGTETLVFNAASHLTILGTFTVGSVSNGASVDMTNGGILTCQSIIISNNTQPWIPGAGTVELTATNTLPTTFFTSFNKLTITSGTTTTGTGLTINSNLSIADGATFIAGAFALTITGTTTVGSGTSGGLTVSSATGTKTFVGLVNIAAGGTWNNSGNSPVVFNGGITNNGTFTAGTGVETFNTNAQALTGTFSIPSVTVNVVTLTNNNSLTVTTNLAGSGTLAQGPNALLNIVFVGSFGITGLTAAANGNTVNYAYAGTQTVYPTSYYHLTLSNTSAKTLLAGTTTIGGNLTLSGTASTLAVVGLVIGGNMTIGTGTSFSPGGFTHSVAGNWSRSGTFTPGTSTIIFNGSLLQTLTASGGENFSRLTINNSGTGIQLINAVIVATAFTMSLGNVDLNSNTLTLGTSASSNGILARTTGTILGVGSFIRWFNTATIASASVAGLFPTGTAADYRPFYISAPSTGPATGGTITLSYSNAITNSNVAFLDGGVTVAVRKDLNWNLASGNGMAGGTYELRAEGTGYGIIGNVADLRLTLINSVTGTAGINAGTNSNPQINRTGLSLLNLTNSFFIASVNALNSPLPIVLLSFSVAVVANYVQLNWSTPAEKDNRFFTVQRSKNTRIWENIQQVEEAATNMTVATYSTYDRGPYAGNSYYRLMFTNLLGERTFSAIKAVHIENTSSTISVFPTPACNQVTISFLVNGNHEVSIIDVYGQVIRGTVIIPGNNFVMDVSNLKAGTYLICAKHDGICEIKKMIIQRN